MFCWHSWKYVKSLNSRISWIKIEVSNYLEKVNESAQAMAIPSDQSPSCNTQKYVIDGQEVSLDPLGMGVRLESKVHLVTCAESAMKNIEKCVRNCGLS